MNVQDRCSVCHSSAQEVFFEITDAPVHIGVLWQSHEAAVNAPRGDIRLGYCRNCGHVFNLAFEPALLGYEQEYDNSLHFSPRFQNYAQALAEQLVRRYQLYEKDLLEIGSGRGDFLRMLCEAGNNRGIGFDPSYAPGPQDFNHGLQIELIQDYYSERYGDQKADFICSRHTLEHIADPVEFIGMLRRAIGERTNTTVFFEVPNFLFTLRENAIWDLIYEHCSYFTDRSLTFLLRKAGFETLSCSETFGGQYLTIEARPEKEPRSSTKDEFQLSEKELAKGIQRFAQNHDEKFGKWEYWLRAIKKAGKSVVIWGAGAKGVSFLNILKTGQFIRYAVDINPRKRGRFIPGTGQEIILPEQLRRCPPDAIIVMNPIYKEEITQTVKDLGLEVSYMYA